MRLTTDQRNRIATRFVEATREIGVLLLAFAPLEFTMQKGTLSTTILVAFLLAGFSLFALSVFVEVRR